MARFRNSFPQPGDPRRDALAQALQYGGMALAQGAGTQGFGALSEAVPAATYGFNQGMEQGYKRQEQTQARQREEEDRRRQGETRQREDTRWEHYLEGIRQAKTEDERKARETEAAKAAEKERREGMLEEIRGAAGDNAARRAALLSPAKLESEYVTLTGAQEPKPPAIRELGGDWYMWDPEHPESDEVGYRLYKKEPAGDGKAEKAPTLTPGQLRNEAQEIANREVGTWSEWRNGKLGALQARFPDNVDVGTGKIGGVDESQLRKAYNLEWNRSFEAAQGQLGGGGANPTGVSNLPPRAAPAAAPAAAAGGFEQQAAAVRQQLDERGAPAAAKQKVEEVIAAVESSVPPEVRDSEEFLALLRQEIAAGKDPAQVAREIREAFGGR